MNTAPIEQVIQQAEAAGILVAAQIIAPDGTTYAHRADEPVRAASTIKLAIMLEAFRQIAGGIITREQILILRHHDKAPGSGVLAGMHTGLELTVSDLLYLMIAISDNTATNMLIDLIGMANINAALQEDGFRQTKVSRRMLGRPATTGEPENLTTAREMARLLRIILTNGDVGHECHRDMRTLLEAQQNERRIGRIVPPGWRWGSKTGSYATVVNDVGFIECPDGLMLLSIFVCDFLHPSQGEETIAQIAKAALQETVSHKDTSDT